MCNPNPNNWSLVIDELRIMFRRAQCNKIDANLIELYLPAPITKLAGYPLLLEQAVSELNVEG